MVITAYIAAAILFNIWIYKCPAGKSSVRAAHPTGLRLARTLMPFAIAILALLPGFWFVI